MPAMAGAGPGGQAVETQLRSSVHEVGTQLLEASPLPTRTHPCWVLEPEARAGSQAQVCHCLGSFTYWSPPGLSVPRPLVASSVQTLPLSSSSFPMDVNEVRGLMA